MLLAQTPLLFQPRSAAPFGPPGTRGLTISVIIPAPNEAQNLPYVLPRIPDWVDEILLVDGCSTDDTVAVALRLCPRVRVISQPPSGKGAALRAGLAAP